MQLFPFSLFFCSPGRRRSSGRFFSFLVSKDAIAPYAILFAPFPPWGRRFWLLFLFFPLTQTSLIDDFTIRLTPFPPSSARHLLPFPPLLLEEGGLSFSSFLRRQNGSLVPFFPSATGLFPFFLSSQTSRIGSSAALLPDRHGPLLSPPTYGEFAFFFFSPSA